MNRASTAAKIALLVSEIKEETDESWRTQFNLKLAWPTMKSLRLLLEGCDSEMKKNALPVIEDLWNAGPYDQEERLLIAAIGKAAVDPLLQRYEYIRSMSPGGNTTNEMMFILLTLSEIGDERVIPMILKEINGQDAVFFINLITHFPETILKKIPVEPLKQRLLKSKWYQIFLKRTLKVLINNISQSVN